MWLIASGKGDYWPVYNVINCLYFSSSFILMNAENLLVVITQHRSALARRPALACDSPQPVEQRVRETVFLDVYKLPPVWLMDGRLPALLQQSFVWRENSGQWPEANSILHERVIERNMFPLFFLYWVNGGFRACRQVFLPRWDRAVG